jgi:hypothetical protein
LELVELLNGAGKVHNISTSFGKGIETHKQGVCGDFPLVLGPSFVVKVGILEL